MVFSVWLVSFCNMWGSLVMDMVLTHAPKPSSFFLLLVVHFFIFDSLLTFQNQTFIQISDLFY
ncbi:hypothetical protein Lalb_Chr05g0225931 [Lupinus albus]|uniref:Uncharacterized protein n=1 Tax=Lupinus albus TaxID=3870 RepID=A0A6A4QJ95_LUPAL|nr:hypothetical protein Lalb_Chr05g0225931 [Lupinus albus]